MTAVTEREPLATPSEVAEYLQIPEHTLAQWRSRGKGPAYSRHGRHVRYRWADVLAHDDQQRRGGEAD